VKSVVKKIRGFGFQVRPFSSGSHGGWDEEPRRAEGDSSWAGWP